ncbi:DUF4388 domain-containing protein [Deinococcus pimensis]|uniref:DUF4388 domain-containing protein n=1 Tax=Deinococcus pimensis TaxID=309888 RepID=UPI001FE10D0B|nr:DUF4388 domain-containing protein [Deinococcus pimensis]
MLLVYSKEPVLHDLELTAHDAGVTVERVSSGEHAERRLQAWRPSLVVCADALDDMPGADLLSRLRRQPALRDTTFALVGAASRADWPASDRDLALDPRLPPTELWRRLARYTGAHADFELDIEIEVPLELVEATRSREPEAARTTAVMRGSIKAFGLFELLGSIQQTRKTGQLSLHFGDDFDADLFFVRGDVTHAEYLGMYGEEALLRAIALTGEVPDTEFTFQAAMSDAELGGVRTITRSTERVLLELAVQIDHAHAGPH